MLKRRIIPKLLLERDSSGQLFQLVTTKLFADSKPVGDPVSQAKIYQAQNVDELMFIDIESKGPDEPALRCVTRLAEEIFMPITIGGGVSTLQHFEELLSRGADKVSINTAALEDRTLVSRAAERFGSQCVVVSIDYRIVGADRPVFCRGGAESANIDAIEWSRICEAEGAGEILLTNIERDGMRNGLDTETIASVCASVSVPVIASGGCGLAIHFAEGMKAGASAVAAGTFFCSQDQSPMQCRSHIKNAGLPVRMQL
jgi:imidazole glycerol-phosphate synthase subunit HisF